MTADVFISYRGADRALARKLEQRLRSRWGSRVFRDETGLAGGDSWADELHTRLRDAAVVLALVGPGWSVSTDRSKEDWVRAELLDAVERGTPILPVLVGDPDVLRKRLSDLPEAFNRQAIVVPEDMPLSSVLEIAKRLRQLGAFEGDGGNPLAAGRAELVADRALARCMTALGDERSVLVEGGGGSGCTALLRRVIAERRSTEGPVKRFVAVCGVDSLDATRSTHAVMGAWLSSLARGIEQLPLLRDRLHYGRHLVEAVLKRGPDLLSRRVVPVSLLLALGDDAHDHQVLQATRRPTERWAPYPPRRLVIQAASVLETFVETAGTELDLVVADVDAVDASSRDLIADLLTTPTAIRLLIAASPSPEENAEALRRLLPAVRHMEPTPQVERVRLDDRTMWGEQGSPLPQWLGRHRIELDQALLAKLDEANPYYALARLWYLTDRGYVVEDGTGARDGDERMTRWRLDTAALDVPEPAHHALLDHMIDEYIPADLHALVHAGALVGRTFPFEVAYRATADDAADAAAVERTWDRLRSSDPDAMVFTAHEVRAGERYVTFALDDLVPHIVERLSPRRRADVHTRLAEAFAASEAAADERDFEASFRAVASAAEHWERAGGKHLRTAADAHRRAAQFAERALAYREAEHHYRVAIRLLAQLIADTSSTDHDHEDLLIVANCQYRLGQMVRLSGKFSDDETGSPETHFDNAIDNLNLLRARLRRREFVDLPGMGTGTFARDDIPGPDGVQHLLRLCDALSGYVMLDKATWLTDRHRHEPAREALFETLRCAELAAGEASSRWLLAAAASRLAESLANQAVDVVERAPGDDRAAADRAHDLAVEALFYIERVVGLRATTPAEERDLADAKALARDVFGRIVTTIHRRPRLAEWVYRKLNAHGTDIRVAEDMSTDFRLGQFLLSLVLPDAPGAELDTASVLLHRYADWARESGLREALGTAYNRLALVEMLRAGAVYTEEAGQWLARARVDPSAGSDTESLLLTGFLHALPTGQGEAPTDAALAIRRRTTVEAFREATAGADDTARRSDEQVLAEGWRRLAQLLLPLCPTLGVVALETAARQIGDELNQPGDPLRAVRQRAETHLDSVRHDRALSPVHDRCIDQLAGVRLSRRAMGRKPGMVALAARLLDVHLDACVTAECAEADVLHRDLRWAAYVYDWYDDVEPARLLVLAGEWHHAVTGSQWATPQLLRGPLAIGVLADQFDGRTELGTERFDRITRLVEHRGVGSSDPSPLEMVFFLAVELVDREDGDRGDRADAADHWATMAFAPGRLADAYRRARDERVADLRAFGRPIETGSGAVVTAGAEPLTGHVAFDAPDPATLAPTGP